MEKLIKSQCHHSALKIIFTVLLISLTVLGCDIGTAVLIINDTELSVMVETKRSDFRNGRKETLLPGDEFGFGFLGAQPPREGQEAVAGVIRKYWPDGFRITYLDNVYHLEPDSTAELMVNNAKYDEKKTHLLSLCIRNHGVFAE